MLMNPNLYPSLYSFLEVRLIWPQMYVIWMCNRHLSISKTQTDLYPLPQICLFYDFSL